MQQIMQVQQEEKSRGSKLKSKLTKITANKKKLSKNLKSKDREVKQLRNDLAAARLSSKGGSSATKSQNERLDKYQRELEDKNRLVAKLRRECDDKNNRISNMEREVSSLKSGGAVVVETHQQVYTQQPVGQQVQQVAHEQQVESDQQDDDEGEDDDNYDDDYEDPEPSNVIEDVGQIDEEVKGELKAIISEYDVDPLFEKLKL